MYKINLFYGYEEWDYTIYHAFEATDPEAHIDCGTVAGHLAEMIQTKPESEGFNWNSVYITLPDTVVGKIKLDVINKLRGLRERFQNAIDEFADEQDFYQGLLGDGITVSDVEVAMGRETACVMQKFCEEHGLI